MSSMTLLPLGSLLRRLARLPRREVAELASQTYEIAPAERGLIPPAVFLPGQDERIVSAVFSRPEYREEIRGGREVVHAACVARLLEDVILADGVLYKADAATFLAHHRRPFPPVLVQEESRRCALYDSPGGIRFFGQWLLDDVLAYPLAQAEGIPVTVSRTMSPHEREYESLLGMKALPVRATRFKELVVFEDFGQTSHKRARFAAVRERLMAGIDRSPRPGVFFLRNKAVKGRMLLNKWELADRLAKTRGLTTVAPLSASVRDILSTCAGARLVVSVEGSQIAHALPAMAPGAALLVIMPPDRFCTVFKDIADREGFRFGFVVGKPAPGGFTVDPDEVERTIDLLLEEKK